MGYNPAFTRRVAEQKHFQSLQTKIAYIKWQQDTHPIHDTFREFACSLVVQDHEYSPDTALDTT